VAGLLLATALLFWWPCLVGGRVPVAATYQQQMPPFGAPQNPPPRAWDALLWDSMAQFYPWRLLLQRGLRSGELPLWDPYQYCGYPFVGTGQSALFYPPNWLLLWIPVKYFLGLSLALHWFLAGLLTFLLARALGLRPGAALLAGAIYQGSGFMIAWCELPTVVNSMAWLPGAWLGVELLFRRRHGGLAVLALSLGMTFLAGHLQFAAYVWLTTVVYALARTLVRWGTRRPAPVGWLALAVLLGLGIGAPQLLPTFELGAASPRGETQVSVEGWHFQQTRALLPAELVTFLLPDAAGNPVTGEYVGFSFTEHCAFAGLTAALLALAGLLWRRDRWALFYALGAAAAISVAMAGPLAYALYFWVPKLGQAGNFSRILGVYTLCLAVLAGMGLDRLLGWVGRHLTGGPALRSGVGALFAAAALGLVLLELVPWGWHFLPLSPAAQVYPETELTRTLEKLGANPEGRILVITPRKNWSIFHVPEALLPPNADTVYGWHSPQGYDSLSLADYRRWVRQDEKTDISPKENGNMMLLENPESWLLYKAGVNWIATLEPLSAHGWALQEIQDGAYVYQRQRPAALYPAVETLNTVRATATGLNGFGAGGANYPGWQAFIDGHQQELVGSGPFKELNPVPGHYGVWMAYYPGSVLAGLFLGLISLMILTACTVAGWRPIRGESGE
jgi:hypothetical protein